MGTNDNTQWRSTDALNFGLCQTKHTDMLLESESTLSSDVCHCISTLTAQNKEAVMLILMLVLHIFTQGLFICKGMSEECLCVLLLLLYWSDFLELFHFTQITLSYASLSAMV